MASSEQQLQELTEWRRKIFKPRERRNNIEGGIVDLRAWGVPEEALTGVEEFMASMLCEGCEGEATSGPHGPDGIYLCPDCLTAEFEQHGFTRSDARKQAAREEAQGAS